LWLPVFADTSKHRFIKLKIVLINIKPHKKVIKIADCARIRTGISQVEMLKLCDMFDIKQLIKVKNDRDRINYSLLAAQYQAIIESGEVINRAQLARLLGVSRAWVTKVFYKGSS
jgi:hypothetical protein